MYRKTTKHDALKPKAFVLQHCTMAVKHSVVIQRTNLLIDVKRYTTGKRIEKLRATGSIKLILNIIDIGNFSTRPMVGREY